MTPKSARNAFTLIELMAVIVVLAMLILLLLSALPPWHHGGRESRSHATLNIIEHALEQYRVDFGTFPPDNIPTQNGSEILAYFLCRPITAGSKTYGPYLEFHVADLDRNGYPELLSPLKTLYEYKLIDGVNGKRVLIVDPGPDRQFGGTIDPKKGFVPDNSGADKDNLYSIQPGQ